MHPQSGAELLSVRMLIKVLPLCVFFPLFFFSAWHKIKKKKKNSRWRACGFDLQSKAKKNEINKIVQLNRKDFLQENVSKLLAVDVVRKMPPSVLLKWLQSTEWRHC